MFKRFIVNIHRWIGVGCSLIIIAVCLSGGMYIYENELSSWLRSDITKINATNTQNEIQVSEVFNNLFENTGGEYLDKTINTYGDSLRAWDASLYIRAPKKDHSFTYLSTIDTYKRVYVNPYNAEVTGIVNEKYDFFNLVLRFHRNLLLHQDIGKPIIGYSIVLFVFLMITGIVLWIPKKWKGKALKASLTIKTKANWKKRFYDWHKVSGFYAFPMALLIAITGLYYAFKPIRAAYIWSLTGKTKITSLAAPENPTLSSFDGVDWNSLIEKSYVDAWGKYPEAWRISFRMPDSDESLLRATAYLDEQTNYKRAYLYYDVQNGALIHSSSYKDRVGGEALVAMNYDIHTGSILGQLSKPIYLIITLILAMLPASGLVIWWQRIFQKKGAITTKNEKVVNSTRQRVKNVA